MDTSLFLDVARFAARTGWAHGFLRAAAGGAGTIFFAVLGAVAFLRARAGSYGQGGPRPIAAVAWAAAGSAASFGLARLLEVLVARPYPGAALRHVDSLVIPAGGHSMPAAAAAIAGGALAGLWIAGDRLMAGLATLGALVVAFACVYDAAAYPGDALAGLGTGIVVVGAGWLAFRPTLTAASAAVARSPFAVMVVAGASARRGAGPGPAARLSQLSTPAMTAAVRVLEDAPVRPVPPQPRATDERVPLPGHSSAAESNSGTARPVIAPPIARGGADDSIPRRGVTILPRERA